jgi:hypothetical protein
MLAVMQRHVNAITILLQYRQNLELKENVSMSPKVCYVFENPDICFTEWQDSIIHSR